MNMRVTTGISKAAGGARVETITDGLQWCAFPRVEPANLIDRKIGLGLYVSGSDTIRLDYRLVLEFENDEGSVTTPRGVFPYIYILLLHEFTHWAADREGIEEEGEVGDKAEEILFGGKVHTRSQFHSLKKRFGTYEAFVSRVRNGGK